MKRNRKTRNGYWWYKKSNKPWEVVSVLDGNVYFTGHGTPTTVDQAQSEGRFSKYLVPPDQLDHLSMSMQPRPKCEPGTIFIPVIIEGRI